MHLVMIGSEYAGKSTLANNIFQWIQVTMGQPLENWHDHFVFPFVDPDAPKADGSGLLSDAERAAEGAIVSTMTPTMLEKYARYMIYYHFLPDYYVDMHHLLINWYYGDAVYAPLYYNYGGPDKPYDRSALARILDLKLMGIAPDTILILVTAAPETIRKRMREQPRPGCILKEHDIEFVLRRFQEEFDRSRIGRQFVLDTTTRTPDETFQEFMVQIRPHLSQADRLALLSSASLA